MKSFVNNFIKPFQANYEVILTQYSNKNKDQKPEISRHIFGNGDFDAAQQCYEKLVVEIAAKQDSKARVTLLKGGKIIGEELFGIKSAKAYI